MGIMENLKKNTFGIVSLVLILVMSMILITQLQGLDLVTTGSYADNASNDALSALGEIPGWFTLIVVIVVFVGIFGLFKFFNKGSK